MWYAIKWVYKDGRHWLWHSEPMTESAARAMATLIGGQVVNGYQFGGFTE